MLVHDLQQDMGSAGIAERVVAASGRLDGAHKPLGSVLHLEHGDALAAEKVRWNELKLQSSVEANGEGRAATFFVLAATIRAILVCKCIMYFVTQATAI